MFDPTDSDTHDPSCCCHWCTGGRMNGGPVPKHEDMSPDFAAMMRETEHDDECPICECGTVEHVNGEIKCRGECGTVVQIVAGPVPRRHDDRIILHAVVRIDPPFDPYVAERIAIKGLHADRAEAFLEGERLNGLNGPKGCRYVVLPARWKIPPASPRSDLIPVLAIEGLPDGVKVAIVSCPDYDAFSALPGAVEIGPDVYGKTGWNSDRQVAYYRTDAIMGAAR